jgi:chorismate synthase
MEKEPTLKCVLLRTEVKASGNVFGNYFQVATYGESHGGGVGCVISGCPPRIPLSEADMQVELDRRYVSYSLPHH